MKQLYKEKLQYLPVFPIAVLVLLLLAGILLLSGKTWAGYHETARAGDSARAAAWSTVMSPVTPVITELRADGTSVSPEVVFSVAADSETACMYTIRFTGVPEGVGISMDGSSFITGSEGSVLFENASWQFAAGETAAQEHRARFKCLVPMDGGTDQIIAEALFTQID